MEKNLKLVWVYGFGDELAEGIFNRDTGDLILILDVYHGDNGDILDAFCRAVGIDLVGIDIHNLIDGLEEEVRADRTDDIPMLDEIKNAILQRWGS